MKLDLNNILFVIIFFNCIFIAGVSLFLKKGKRMANVLFAAFLLAKTICFSTSFFYLNFDYAVDNFLEIFLIGTSFDLLLGPLMYFYIRSLCYKNFVFKKTHFLHLVPFLLHLGYLSIIFYSKDIATKKELLQGTIYTSTYAFVNGFLIYFSFVVYASYIIREIVFYHKAIKAEYSDFNKAQMKWMAVLISGLLAIWLYGIVAFILSRFQIYLNNPITVYLIPIFIFSNVIFFYGMQYSEVFAGIEEPQSYKKYRKTEIPDDKKEELLQKIISYIESEKPYLDPDINISDLAEELAVPSYQISQILNSKLNKNFFEFISYYRIKESMEHLSQANNKTVLEILYEVGFNSKSAFNTAFKKHTGLTPTEFKRRANTIGVSGIVN